MINKKEIIENICYTELIYGRINKKLNIKFSKKQMRSYSQKQGKIIILPIKSAKRG